MHRCFQVSPSIHAEDWNLDFSDGPARNIMVDVRLLYFCRMCRLDLTTILLSFLLLKLFTFPIPRALPILPISSK